jgi:hypothetical protein
MINLETGVWCVSCEIRWLIRVYTTGQPASRMCQTSLLSLHGVRHLLVECSITVFDCAQNFDCLILDFSKPLAVLLSKLWTGIGTESHVTGRQFSSKWMYQVFQKELYYGNQNVTVWRVLRKHLTERRANVFVNTRHTVAFGIPLQSFYEISCTTHWTRTLPGKTRCIFLNYSRSKHCTYPLNKCI